ncbi:MAG: hypothetical protein IH820_01140 [Bacteroidetes bacterium]|nr:hypothetical protein [Bacteroidota bacterium]
MIRLIGTYFSKPLSRLLMRLLPLDNPWERFASSVPLSVYGMGARREFRWYFEGRSSVEIQSIEEIQEWLLGCEYVSDPDLFQEADFWQHPCTFEQLRKGDCEDFALWAWRKMVRLGYQAEFVAGRCLQPGCSDIDQGHGHTWLVFEKDEAVYLFDPIIRERDHMIQPLDAVRHEYIPEVSVDQHFNRYAYAGYYLKRRGEKRSARRHQPPVTVPQVG